MGPVRAMSTLRQLTAVSGIAVFQKHDMAKVQCTSNAQGNDEAPVEGLMRTKEIMMGMEKLSAEAPTLLLCAYAGVVCASACAKRRWQDIQKVRRVQLMHDSLAARSNIKKSGCQQLVATSKKLIRADCCSLWFGQFAKAKLPGF